MYEHEVNFSRGIETMQESNGNARSKVYSRDENSFDKFISKPDIDAYKSVNLNPDKQKLAKLKHK